MAFKFPFTNYHELNLTWVLDQLKKLFEDSAENVSVIQNYDGRLTAVETELPTVSETASEASRAAAAAATLAQTAKATADTAQENAIQAQTLAGTARQEAQAARTAADAATQAAQQAQATAQNFDGRITEAQNNASQALESSRSFENRVQAAINTANNADSTATIAQGIATNANQHAAEALDKIGDLSALDTTAKQNLVAAINEALENGGKVDSVNGQTGAVVLDAGDIGYNNITVADKLDELSSASDIIISKSGNIIAFPDGAENAPVENLVVDSSVTAIYQRKSNLYEIPDHAAVTQQNCTFTQENGEVIYNDPGTSNDRMKSYIIGSTPSIHNYNGYVYINRGNTIKLPAGDYYFIPILEFITGSLSDFNDNAWLTINRTNGYGRFNQIEKTITTIYLKQLTTTKFTVSEDRTLVSISLNPWRETSNPAYSFRFKCAIVSADLQAIYTPFEGKVYQVENGIPTEIIKTYLGNNTFYTDNTTPLSFDYKANTKLYIDGKISELQALVLENNG